MAFFAYSGQKGESTKREYQNKDMDKDKDKRQKSRFASPPK
jgi:hypothetical protein